MKKIINWSFGAFFRTIGRVLAYLLIGVLILVIGAKSGLKLFLMPVSASTVSVSNGKYALYGALARDEKICPNASSFGYKPLDTNINVTSRPYVRKIHYLFNANLEANNSYTISFVQSYSPKSYAAQRFEEFIYRVEGSTTTNDSGLSANNISSFKCFATDDKNNAYKVNIFCNIVPFANIKTIWIEQLQPNCNSLINSFNTYTLKVNLNSSTEESINNQTEVIKDSADKIIKGQDKINDTITDTSSPDTEDSINQWSEKMIDNPLEAVVMLPLNILNSIKTGLNGTCSPLNVPVPFIDETIQIPCISSIFAQIEGVTEFWNSIGTIVSAIMLYQYLIYLYNWIDDTISLKTKRMQGWGSV